MSITAQKFLEISSIVDRKEQELKQVIHGVFGLINQLDQPPTKNFFYAGTSLNHGWHWEVALRGPKNRDGAVRLQARFLCKTHMYYTTDPTWEGPRMFDKKGVHIAWTATSVFISDMCRAFPGLELEIEALTRAAEGWKIPDFA